jgi:sterol 3beta-glucosyltransferase
MAAEKITILAFGSTGELTPYLALSLGLRAAGYRVNLVTNARYAGMLSKYDIGFFGIDDDPATVLRGESGQQWTAGGTNVIKQIKSLVSGLDARLRLYAEHSMQQSEGSDLLIASQLATLGAVHVAEKLKIKIISALISPLTPTTKIANALMPTFFDTSPENWVSHKICYRLASIAFRRTMSDLRRELGLEPSKGCEPFSSMYSQQLPVLYGYSEAVLPRPPDWTEHTQVTGYWFLPRAADWQPPDDLADFLASGSPPVCIGFGSMIYGDPEAAADLVLGALKQVGCRGLLLTGWGAMKPKALPDDVYATDSVPHDWLFPRVAASVHHGGQGTAAAALRAGVPAVSVPFLGDNHFWARRFNQLGVATRPIPRTKLSAQALAQAISVAINDGRLKRNATHFAERISSEDGVRRAVEEVSRYLRN